MKHSDYLKKKKNRETRKKIVSVISAIVVFITTYALVLPAITLDVSRASREPGIAYEQMQFKATASAASVTAADSTVEEAQVEEPAAEEPAEEETIKEEAAEIPEEETPAVSDAQEEAEKVAEEAPAEPEQEEAPAAEAEEVQEEEDKSVEEKADVEPSSEPAQEETQDTETQKSADQTAVDQSGKSDAGTADAASAASTEKTAEEFQIPTLDPIDFDEILTGKTDFYFYHVEKTEEDENITSDSVDDWKKVSSDTVLAPEDFVRVYLSYEIPAGSLNETNAEARYRLPAGLELSEKQVKDINKYENGIAASKSGREHDKYLGAEAIEGSRTPNEKAGDEYISATVKAEKVYKDGEYVGQDLIFTFIPYTVEKNQISYDEAGKLTSEGRSVKGFFTFDLTTAQIDFEKTEKETVEKEDGTKEEIQYSRAEVVFVKENNKKNIDEISRILTMAGPSEKEEPQVQEPKTLISKGEGNDYTVTVSYTDDAQIPDNAELAVREIEKDTDEYASYLEQAKGAVDENKSVNEARFFDITIVADGEKIEPQAPVNVQITFTGIEQTNTDDTQLLHYKDDKEVEVMDQAEFSKSEEPENETKAVDTVQFETDGFSVYGIIGTGIITNEARSFDFTGNGYEIHLDVPAEALIPEGTELIVEEIGPESEKYLELLGEAWTRINAEHILTQEQIEELMASNSEENDELFPEAVPLKNIDGVRFFDITFMYEGEEIEPCAPVEVQINLDEGMQTYEHQGTEVVHFGSAGTEIINGVDARLDGDNELVGVGFSQDSFSPVGIFTTSSNDDSEEGEAVEERAHAFTLKNFLTLFAPMTVYAAEGDYVISGKAINGTVVFYSDAACTSEITEAHSGSRVYIKATPDTGYYYSATTVTKVDGTPATDVTVERVGTEGNIYSFVMPEHDVLVTGVFQPPPEADKKLEPNGDGTYTLNLSVKGTSADLSAAASTSKKVNVIVVMDRSTSMVRSQNDTTIYEEYPGPTYPASDGPYWGLVDGKYVELNWNNGIWTYQVPRLIPYSGTRYQTTTGTTGTQYGVYNNTVVRVYYHEQGHWSRSPDHVYNQYNDQRYTGTRYLINTDATSDTWGFVNNAMTSLTYIESDNTYYYTSGTVAQTYSGTIYTEETVSRLYAEQQALDTMLDSLLSYNNDEIEGLEDVVEVEVISFASGRGDGDHNTSGIDPDTQGSTSGYTGITETSLSYDKDTLMTAVNNNSTSSGTNWQEAMEYALDEANEIHGDQPTEDVYILFLTDGEPTTHNGDYSAVGPQGYAAELQYALQPARDLVNAAYYYPDNYEDETLAGMPTEKKNYLYGVFTYGSENGNGQTYLKQLVNFAYGYGTTSDLRSDDDRGYLSKYFFDARDNASLLSAMDSFIAAVFSSLAYGNVNITDGVTIGGTNSVTSSTLVSGTAGGFEYTVKGPNLGDLYTVTATGPDDNPTVTFHVNGRAYTGLQKTKAIHITGDDPKTETVETEYDQTLTYWYFDETNYPNYKICLATVDDDGLVHWDLSGVGALQNGWTYNVGFTVWPNQDAYDYAAGLNNKLGGDYTWDLANQQDSGKGYYTNGTKYPYLVRYGAQDNLEGSTYSVLTNYEQSMSYNVLSEVTTNGVTQLTYGATATVDMDPPDPMDLTGSNFTVTKNWNDQLDPSHLADLIKKAEEQDTKYGITLDLYEGKTLYKSYRFEPVYNEEKQEYEWPSQDISIAPALLVSELPEGTNTESYKTVTYNNKTYYVLNQGHEYTIKEQDTGDWHFEFHADTYHPALIDGVMTNVEFRVDEQGEIINGSTATQVGTVPLETFAADNSLTAELDITKIIKDTNDSLTDEQEDDETFTYEVTLTVPAGADASHIYGYEFIPRLNDEWDGVRRIYIHGYQGEEGSSTPYEEDSGRFLGKVYGRWQSFVYSAFEGMDVTTERTVTVYLTLNKNGVIRFNNLPKGTRYSITEIAANVGTADDSNNYTTPITSFTVPTGGTPEEQGYVVTSKSSKGTANGKTITGEITELDTRYYNQFTNTLDDAAAVDLRVTKQLQGYTWGNDERYYVRLSTDENNITLKRFTDLRRYLTNTEGSSESKSYDYTSSLRFAKPGTYTYYFDEMSDNTDDATVVSGTVINGVQYDRQKKLIITVGDVNNKLVITEIKDGDGNIVYSTDTDAEIKTGYVDYVNGVINTTITNKVIPLSIYKFGGSELSEIDNKLVGVQFKLYSDADLTQLVTQDARGNAVGTDGLITIGDDGTASLGVFNTGKYYLVETNLGNNGGYNKLTDAVEIEIGSPIHYKQIGWSPSEQYSSASDVSDLVKTNGGMYINYAEDGTTFAGYTFTINNNTGYELPNTGGSGTLPYTLGGIALIMASALMYGFRMRRRERRFN